MTGEDLREVLEAVLLSWSVRERPVRWLALARRTTSSGGRVPSDAVE